MGVKISIFDVLSFIACSGIHQQNHYKQKDRWNSFCSREYQTHNTEQKQT
jgi:hypothetical protein